MLLLFTVRGDNNDEKLRDLQDIFLACLLLEDKLGASLKLLWALDLFWVQGGWDNYFEGKYSFAALLRLVYRGSGMMLILAPSGCDTIVEEDTRKVLLSEAREDRRSNESNQLSL